MKKLTLLLICLTPLILLTGCDPFDYPHGLWECEELGITLDFFDGVSSHPASGEIIIDNTVHEIIAFTDHGGQFYVDFPTGENNETRQPLYQGRLKHVGGAIGGQHSGGRGEMLFHASEMIDGEWVEIGEFSFTKIDREGDSPDIRNASVEISIKMIIIGGIPCFVGFVIILVLAILAMRKGEER